MQVKYLQVFIPTENFCNRPVGIQNGRIKNSAMTASSQWDVNHASWLARLHRARRGRLMGAWSSRHNNHHQWLQIDMGRFMKCSGINTQGRQDADQWVTAYQILYGSDGTRFSYVREWWDNIKVSVQRLKEFIEFKPGSDAVLHVSRIEFKFRPTQINLDRLN